MTEKIENPPQTVTKHGHELPFELDLDSVSDWLQSLPININGAYNQVYAALKSFNITRCDARLRLGILEKLRPVIYFLTGKSLNVTADESLAGDRKQRKAAKLSVKFHTELAIGYRLVAKSRHFNGAFSESDQSLIVHRAMRSLSFTLMVSYQNYEPYSTKVWRDMNWLYKKAEENGLTSVVVADNQHPFATKTTINSLYKCISILAYINPYRFHQSEITEIYTLLERIADDAYLSPDLHKEGLTASLCIDLEHGRPPARNSHSIQFATSRYFFTRKFVATLTRLHDDAIDNSDSKNYLARVIQYFAHSPQIAKSGERQHSFLIQGFDEIYQLLVTSRGKLPGALNTKSTDQEWLKTPSLELVPMEYESLDRRANNTGNASSKSFPRFHQMHGGLHNGTNKGNNAGCTNCYVTPLSINGFSVLETDTTLLDGGITAFWSPQNGFHLGTIRWKKGSEITQRLRYGLELIGSDAYPATAAVGVKPAVKVLLLKRTRNKDQQQSIISPPVKWKCGAQINVKRGRRTHNYKIHRLMELNERFCHYSIIEADH